MPPFSLYRWPLMISALIFAVLASARPSALRAQSHQIESEQSITWNYGQDVTFHVTASAPTAISGARLTVKVPNSQAQYVAAVAVNNSTRISASQRVSVQELGLAPASSITYFWDFEDQTGQQYRSVTVTDRYFDNRVPWEWASVQKGSLTVLTEPSDELASRTALEVTESVQQSTSRLLGRDFSSPITIYVYPDLASLANSLRVHHVIVQDWVAAYATPDHQTIFVASENGPDLHASLERDIRHEITHIAIAHAADANVERIPGWFNEGMAIYNSGDLDPGLQNALDDAISKRVLPSLPTLCVRSFASLPPREAALAYAESASVIHYIADRYGTSQLAALMSAYAQGQECSDAVRLVLGISLTELESQWLRNLSVTASQPTSSDNPLLPWVIGWIASLILAILFVSPQPPQAHERSAVETHVALPQVPMDQG